MLQGDALVLYGDALVLQGDALMLQANASILQGDALMLQANASMLQGDDSLARFLEIREQDAPTTVYQTVFV